MPPKRAIPVQPEFEPPPIEAVRKSLANAAQEHEDFARRMDEQLLVNEQILQLRFRL